jgi:uncharacterized protein YukE
MIVPSGPSNPTPQPFDKSGFTVDVANLAGNAPQYADVATDILSLANSTAQALAPLGKFWGLDKYGDAFSPAYTQSSSAIFMSLTALVEDMNAISQALTQTAKNYGIAAAADQAGATAIHGPHGGPDKAV